MDYYRTHAAVFIQSTVDLDMSVLHDRFLEHVPDGGRILDAGCGSGRDAKAFLDRGYDVVATDASPEMVEHATRLTGRPALVERLEEIDYEEEFDAVWTCASLIHIPEAAMPDVFRRCTRALRPGGVWYISFKLGRGERRKGERLFTDCDEETLGGWLAEVPGLETIEVWRTEDLRPERAGEFWVNGIVRKRPGPSPSPGESHGESSDRERPAPGQCGGGVQALDQGPPA